MHGKYAKGLDPAQASGLSLRPTAMLPRVFKGANPSDPSYTRLASLPAAQLAMLSKGYKGTPSSLANKVGKVYKQAGTTGKIPSTATMQRSLVHSKGINAMFSGQKAGKGDYESTLAPGYAYGQEPLPMGEAAGTMAGLLDAMLINESLPVQAKYSGSMPGSWGSYLIDKGSSKALGKKAGRGVPLNKFVGRRIFRK